MKSIACLLLMAAALFAFGQPQTEDINASTRPARIKLAALGADYKAYKLKSPGKESGGGGLLDSMGSMLGSLMESISSDMTAAAQSTTEMTSDEAGGLALDYLGISWTKYEVAVLGTEKYYITYVPRAVASMMSEDGPPDISKLDLQLVYVKTDSLLSISPRPDITKDSVVKLGARMEKVKKPNPLDEPPPAQGG